MATTGAFVPRSQLAPEIGRATSRSRPWRSRARHATLHGGVSKRGDSIGSTNARPCRRCAGRHQVSPFVTPDAPRLHPDKFRDPCMNSEIIAMLEASLATGRRALVLTNAMRPMRRFERQLTYLRDRYGDALTLRVSLDRHSCPIHEAERGADTWAPALSGLKWLGENGFSLAIAGRRLANETEGAARVGYAALLGKLGVSVDLDDPARLILFPEMDATRDAPEITEACWGILNVSPDSVNVRLQPDGREAQGRRPARRRRLHADSVRPAVRTGLQPGRGARKRAAQPPALLQVLRAGRSQLQRAVSNVGQRRRDAGPRAAAGA